MILARTWPYGTRRRVRVRTMTRLGGQAIAVCVLLSDPTEAHFLAGVDCTGVEAGQEREIVFRDGGPLGGYWDFHREGLAP